LDEGDEVVVTTEISCNHVVNTDENHCADYETLPIGFTDLQRFVNENKEKFDVGGEYENSVLTPLLFPEVEYEDCEPETDCVLSETPISAEKYISDVEGEEIDITFKALDDYIVTIPPSECDVYSTNPPTADTSFQTEYGFTPVYFR